MSYAVFAALCLFCAIIVLASCRVSAIAEPAAARLIAEEDRRNAEARCRAPVVCRKCGRVMHRSDTRIKGLCLDCWMDGETDGP